MGLIGLGNMGSAFAERLLDAGYPLVVHNRSREKAEPLAARGASVADTAADLAAPVVNHEGVAGVEEALCERAAHVAEPDQPHGRTWVLTGAHCSV